MNLVVVESPTKARTLQSFLGPAYKVLSCYGHIRDLPEQELGVDIEHDFKPQYIIPQKSKKIIRLLAKNTQKANLTILATDEDREGEAIAWHLSQTLGLGKFQAARSKTSAGPAPQDQNLKPYQRIVFHEITKPAIEEALKNPRPIDMNLVDAQQARRVLDRLVGYQLSPFLWKKIARGLSAGRVQSVAVRLVVEREREIEQFTPQEYWTIEARFKKISSPKSAPEFTAVLVKKNEKVLDKLAIKSKSEADKIVKDLQGAGYEVQKVEKKEVKRYPLPPFTTSTLQQEAWKRFKWSSKLTMRVAQQLYEKGLCTYHRTDSLNLSSLALNTARQFITQTYGPDYHQFRKYKTKGRAQEAHEAIRPTYTDKTPDKIKLQNKTDENQFRLYGLIWKRFVASQMKEACFEATTVEIKTSKQTPASKSQRVNYTFRASGQRLKFDGFLKVYPLNFEEKELPELRKAEVLELLKLTPSQHFTLPPPRYTEATLIKKLETEGIGRPSTYAPIISTIQERNYIEKDEKKCFRPTEIGRVVNDLLVKHFPKIVDLKFTAALEKKLDEIAKGKQKWVALIKGFYGPFAENLKQKYQEVSKKEFTEEPTQKKCKKCGAPLIIRLGKYGRFYACSKYPQCGYTQSLPQNLLGIPCPRCLKGEIVEKRTKKRKIFYGCNRFPRCEFALWDKPTGEKCAECGSLLVKTKKGIKCSNRSCARHK